MGSGGGRGMGDREVGGGGGGIQLQMPDKMLTERAVCQVQNTQNIAGANDQIR